MLLAAGCRSPRLLDLAQRPESLPLPVPALLARAQGDTVSQPLPLRRVSVSAVITGDLARTTVEMEFENPQDRVLEGRLMLPLLPEQTVAGLALELKDGMRQAVAVERTLARTAYESAVRQFVDPALLEYRSGNTFELRIFPIEAGRSRRVQVTIEELLEARREGLRYRIPLRFREPLAGSPVRIEIRGAAASADRSGSGIRFRPDESGLVADTLLDLGPQAPPAEVLLPGPGTAPRIAVAETGPDSTFWYASVRTAAPARPRTLARRLALYWDASRSGLQQDSSRIFPVLDAYLARSAGIEVELIACRDQPAPPERFSIQGGDWSGLRRRLASLDYDGGLCLGCVDFGAVPADEAWWVGNGVSVIGPDTLLTGAVPVSALNSAAQADPVQLRRLCAATGGQYADLRQLSREEALLALQTEPLQLQEIRVLSGAVSEVYPRPGAVANGRLGIAGRLHSDEAVIEIVLGYGGVPAIRETLRIDKAASLGGGDVEQIWARKQAETLESGGPANREAIVRLGKRYGLATRYTSLLVLEAVQDYVKHRIPPPEPLRAEYERLAAQEDQARQLELMTHLDQVAEAYAERIGLWETEFKAPEGPYVQQDQLRDTDRDGVPDRSDASGNDAGGLSDLFALEQAKPDAEPGSISEGIIRMEPWNPAAPYLAVLRSLPQDARYPRYLALRAQYGAMPAFYLDVSGLFFESGDTLLGLRILSSLAALPAERHELLRVLGRRLELLGRADLALRIYARVLEIREEEPQSLRDLALAHARLGQAQQAADLLYEVVQRPWDDRFPRIGVLAAGELNELIARYPQQIDTRRYDPRLLRHLPADLRVVMNWDADGVDLDLWVTDPRGEKCYYAHPVTESGGFISPDMTGGYGPEEFWIRKALPGEYRIQANYYGARRVSLAGPATLHVQITAGYGRPEARTQEVIVRLGQDGEVLSIGTVEWR